MTTSLFQNEEEIQKKIIEAIENQKLSEIILDHAKISDYLENQDNILPQFSIDHLARKSILKAGQIVLDSFNLLEILTSDKNVSISKNEVLRPDIVCINPEKECIVIFELKNATQTGRQALTELLAYEQELKNSLPLLSNYDVMHVLISSEWSTLMDHAASSAITWSGKNLLCLDASLENGEMHLITRVPSAWKITGSVYFPDDALPSVTVCLYEKDAYTSEFTKDDEKKLDARIWTALEVMAREGDRVGSNGFALLWKDHSSITLTKYNITLCGVSPFSFYKQSRTNGQIGDKDGRLVEKLDKYINEYDPQGHTESLLHIATFAYPLLKEVSDPRLEGFHFWYQDRQTFLERAEPLLCEFWGALGDYARQYVMNPAIRKHRPNMVLGGKGDWRNPEVGLPLISSFSRPEIFFEGEVRCSDAFNLGVLLGIDRIMRFNLKKDEEQSSLKCRYEWNRIELMSIIDEIRLLADAAENVSPPASPLIFSDDPQEDDEADFDSFLTWLVDDFFQESHIHVIFLYIGINGALAFDGNGEGIGASTVLKEYIAPIEKEIIQATQSVLSRYRQLHEENGFYGVLEDEYKRLCKELGLSTDNSKSDRIEFEAINLVSIWPTILEAADHILDNVFHKHHPVENIDIDWTWLQQGVSEMRKRGVKDAGVILLANGQVVTGSVFPDGFNLSMNCDESKNEVLFHDRSHGISNIRIVTWDDLKSGEIFGFNTEN